MWPNPQECGAWAVCVREPVHIRPVLWVEHFSLDSLARALALCQAQAGYKEYSDEQGTHLKDEEREEVIIVPSCQGRGKAKTTCRGALTPALLADLPRLQTGNFRMSLQIHFGIFLHVSLGALNGKRSKAWVSSRAE